MVHSQRSKIVIVDVLLYLVLSPDFAHQPFQHLARLTVEISFVYLKALASLVYYFEGLHQRPLDIFYPEGAMRNVVGAIQRI